MVRIEYTRNPYTLTVNYEGPADGVFAAPEAVSEEHLFGEAYNVKTPAVPGYTPDNETVTGFMPAKDKTITVTYAAAKDTAYTVQHFKANLDGSFNKAADDTDTLTGVTGDMT